MLLLGNIAFAVVTQLPRNSSGTEPLSAHAPFHAEKIRLVSEEDIPPPVQPVSAAPQVCLEWGLFAKRDIALVKTALQPLELDESKLVLLDAPEKANSYWVYIPPLKSRQDAQKKVDELKTLGVEDSFVMQDANKWRHAISLGVFSTVDAAEKYLLTLREKGVKSAKSGPRNPEGGLARLVIRSGGANIEAQLVKLKQEFPGTELKAVPCSN